MAATRLVIVGGGFAGSKCAKTLRQHLSPGACEIVLFNRENHMVFHPLLAEVAGASINPDAVAAPLRQMLPTVHCRTEEVQHIDLEASELVYHGYDDQPRTMIYDHLVLACDSAVNLGTVPGMADHALPLKTIGDAITLRLHIMQLLEKAEVCDDEALKRHYLSFIIVGGGFSGVEVAGEINDLLRGTHRFFHNISGQDLTVTLVHSRDQLLPEITPSLRDFAKAKMERAGINLALNTRVQFVTPEGVGLLEGPFLRGATVVCTVGNTIPSVLERLEVPKTRNRLMTEPDMRLAGFDNAWAIGDCAHIINAYDQEPSPPTGQFAERQGRQAADNIVRVMRGEPTQPFRFKPLGQLCAIGGHHAVAELFGQRLSGFPAWFLWRGVYLAKLPSWSRRAKVGFDWAWDLVFPRDLAHPRTDPTERVSTAHYRPGNEIIREGEPALNFYIIVSGEVEVMRIDVDSGETRQIAVLGPGDFFGEMALIDQRPRSATIRALTPLEVMVMGKNLFSSISHALAPFRHVIAEAIKRRGSSLWQRMPMAREVLETQPLSAFLEPCAIEPLTPDHTFADALQCFDEHGSDFCCVTDPEGCLQGVVTRTDIFRAIDAGADARTPVRAFMASDPVIVTDEESCLVAAATMRDHGFKWLPVVESYDTPTLKGYVRAERMLNVVVQHMPEKDDRQADAHHQATNRA